MARGKDIYTTCATCHGQNGQGDRKLGAPNIAGLPDWYIVREIRKFRAGHRGFAPADTVGRRMAVIAGTLDGDEAIQAVAAYVSRLPPVRIGSTVDGDPEKGKVEYQACASCHANDGAGRPGLPGERVPPVAGLADWYVVSQIEAFKKGWRGVRTSDVPAMQMRAVVIPLDSAATLNVTAYIRTFQ
jgi:cytochrome c oxidase subunit 2